MIPIHRRAMRSAFGRGNLVEVRSADEILATLDDRGSLDAGPPVRAD